MIDDSFVFANFLNSVGHEIVYFPAYFGFVVAVIAATADNAAVAYVAEIVIVVGTAVVAAVAVVIFVVAVGAAIVVVVVVAVGDE